MYKKRLYLIAGRLPETVVSTMEMLKKLHRFNFVKTCRIFFKSIPNVNGFPLSNQHLA